MPITAKTLDAVIFDHSTIFPQTGDAVLVGKLRSLLENLKAANLKIGVFSTHPLNLASYLSKFGYPGVDLLLTKADVGTNKGTKDWINLASTRLQTTPHSILYVGDEKRDWVTAINTATFYAHAGWIGALPSGLTAYVFKSPLNLWLFITHFLLSPPRWEHALDNDTYKLHLRGLIGASVELPATKPATFNAKTIFTYNQAVSVNGIPAQSILMSHALTSLYLEGLIEIGSYLSIYPSSTPGRVSPVLQAFIEPASRIFHSYFKEDLLVRGVQGLDTSRERAAGRHQNVTFARQTDTVHLHPTYKGKVNGRSIVVIDDFTTSGKSLEWARNLLLSAGARRVILLAIGKFKHTHTVHTPYDASCIRPFELTSYDSRQFSTAELSVNHYNDSQDIIRRSFEFMKQGLPLPV